MSKPRFVALVLGVTLFAGGASAATLPGPDLESTSLIVKFERQAASPILPEDVVDVVTDAVATQGVALTGADWALYSRIGSPANVGETCTEVTRSPSRLRWQRFMPTIAKPPSTKVSSKARLLA